MNPIVDATLRASLVLLAGLACRYALSRHSPALRHAVLAVAVVMAPVVGLASAWLPGVPVQTSWLPAVRQAPPARPAAPSAVRARAVGRAPG